MASDEAKEGADFPSLLDRLSSNAATRPSKTALTFLSSGSDGGSVSASLTYSELDVRTTALAHALLTKHSLPRGERAALVYPPGLDFAVAFVACLKAGIVAVPVFPPHPARGDTIRGFAGIVEGCGAKKALTSGSYNHAKKLGEMKEKLGRFKKASSPWPEDLEWIITDGDISKDGKLEGQSLSPPSPADTAFLQYTSGSTSAPKGVMITHGNLAHNLRIITSELEAVDDTVVVSWLPQYHDMGLIGSYLGILYCGGCGYYMSPLTFLPRPMIWIEAVSKYRGTHLQAPNFAFKLTARKFDASSYSSSGDKALDLSSVRHIINGAEPCTSSSMDAFLDAFGPFGLRKEVMFPTYGLAEHTVFVCSGGKQRLRVRKRDLEVDGKVVPTDEGATGQGEADADNEDSRAATTTLIGCGYPSRQGVDVCIVDPETCVELADDAVGEIWIRSPSKAAGYFDRPEVNKTEFRARIKSGDSDEAENDISEDEDPSMGYLRTGDLGFLHSSELFVCGRSKDLLIIGGRNYYPQDIESTAEDAASEYLRPGCSAAFSVNTEGEEGGEEVVYVAELREVPSKKDVDSVCKPIVEVVRAAINKENSLAVTHFCFLKTRTVPKTTSGKISRSRCRKGYVGDTLDVVYRKSFQGRDSGEDVSPSSPLEIDQEAKGTIAPANKAPVDAAAIRALSKSDILKRLTADVARLTSSTPDAIDKKAALIAVLDSLSLSQFKGMLESEYALTKKLSDEYLFRESTTLEKVVEVVKLGYAPDDNGEGGGGAGGASPATAVGGGGGLAQAMGCPPGVVCCVVM